ncbi:MAG: hypothetical protein ABR583_02905 [Gaiellaceae bacterium]
MSPPASDGGTARDGAHWPSAAAGSGGDSLTGVEADAELSAAFASALVVVAVTVLTSKPASRARATSVSV